MGDGEPMTVTSVQVREVSRSEKIYRGVDPEQGENHRCPYGMVPVKDRCAVHGVEGDQGIDPVHEVHGEEGSPGSGGHAAQREQEE